MASRRQNIPNALQLQSKESEFRRLATFVPALRLELPFSQALLANAGFYFKQEDVTAVCEGCEFKIDLRRRPSLESNFNECHRDECAFLNALSKTLSARSTKGPDIASNAVDADCIDVDGAPGDDFLSAHPVTVTFSHAPGVDSKQEGYVGGSQHGEAFLSDNSLDFEISQTSYGSGNVAVISQATNDVYCDSEEATGDINSDLDSGYCPSSPEGSCVDSEIYDYEYDWFSNAVKSDGECTKNPGHYGYFNLSNLRPEQLPSSVRCPEMVTILKLLGDLTVRLSVSHSSQDRPPGYSNSGHEASDPRMGTGFIFHQPGQETDQYVQMLRKDKLKNAKISGIKKLVPFRKKSGFVYIQTNRHVVFDNKEAAATTVEVMDGSSERNVVKLKGKFVLFSKAFGQSDVLLVCKCNDLNLLKRLNKTRQELLNLAENLPKKAKLVMMKKVFLVQYPHGKNQVVSYGDSVVVKYEVKKEKNANGNQLVKLTGQQQVPSDVKNVLKSLFYVADTCPGSSGAPVIKFKRGPPDANGQCSLLLDVWMHDGVDKFHKLNGSILKACTWEDLRPSTALDAEMTAGQEEDDDQESLGNQSVNSPCIKVQSVPSYPNYVSFKSRLKSYTHKWNYSHIHLPENLAMAGFFYADYSDCVRCFHCGLGLRSWKAGDDINTEHKKNRPSCPYLQTLLSSSRPCPDSKTNTYSAQSLSGSKTTDNAMLVLDNQREYPQRRYQNAN
ncbi:hypothetical protein Btru_077442 [Bulinus truncatus]|nr:hypothetical protein Btru_077442 [Bulinus truncatus]